MRRLARGDLRVGLWHDEIFRLCRYPMHDLRGRLVRGTFFHAPRRGSVDILEDALVEIDAAGTIVRVTGRGDLDWTRRRDVARAAGLLEEIGAGRYVLPGFVDLHIHAPQYPQLGTALHLPLADWLATHTFPLEARYRDLAFARRVYAALLDDLVENGTTTALMFGTVHVDATKLLGDLAIEKGLRALVGKVAMDHPDNCPPDYRDRDVASAVAGTRALIEHLRDHPHNRAGRVEGVITPRFIPSCTDPLLEELGALARVCSCAVQTHCSESDWEHAYVRTRHGISDAESLDRFGLLGRRSIVAHAPFLSASDMDLLAARGSAVAHCPLSNAYFANAVFPLRAALAKGLRVGLGTDVSAGPSLSMFDAARMAVVASRMLEEGVDPARESAVRGQPQSRIDWMTAFHLATAGGADALDLPVGRFEAGCRFDALVIDTQAPWGNLRLFDEIDGPLEVLQKILHGATRADIRAVHVDGRMIAGDPPIPRARNVRA